MNGRLSKRFGKALRAGGVTLLLGLFCTAALAAPKLSTIQGFAHTHPHGTPHHLHPIIMVFSGTLPVIPTTLADRQQGIESLLPACPTCYIAAETFAFSRSRAPPEDV